jgi:hypothetical protein
LFVVGVIIFGSIRFLSKKSNQTEIFKKKKTKPGQTDRFRFCFLGKKLVQTSLARFSWFWLGFFPIWLGFSGLARFWLCLALFGSVFFRFWFGFFGFLLIKAQDSRRMLKS